MGLFFNGSKLAKFTDTISGGINLLDHTLDMQGFNNMGNTKSAKDVGTIVTFSIDGKEEYSTDTNSDELKTNVFHVYGQTLNESPMALDQDVYLPAGTWTLSFLAKNNSSRGEKNIVSLFSDWCENIGWLPLGNSDPIDNSWRKHQIVFETSQGINHKNLRVHNTSNSGVPGGSLYFANLKLEAGSQATTYCPSYTDILNELEAIKNKMGGVIASFMGYFFNHEEVAV